MAVSVRPHRQPATGSTKTVSRSSLIVALLALSVGLVIVAARLTGVPVITPVTQLISFYPLTAAIWLAMSVGALLTRKWMLLSVGVTLLVVTVATSMPSTASPEGAVDGSTIRVVASNVYVGEATQALADKIASEVEPVDVLLVEECTDMCAQVLSAEPMRSLFPHQHVDAQPGARGAAILSRTPLTDRSSIVRPIARAGALAMPSAGTAIEDVAITIKVAHPFPPIPFDLGQWRSDLDGLAEYAAATPGPLIMGGDFNATVYHQPFRAITENELADALSTDAGTWPSDLPELVAAPIDHILFRAPFAVVASGTWNIDGSDHRTVWAEFRLMTP